MAKRRTFEVRADAPEVAAAVDAVDTVDQADTVDQMPLEVPAELEAPVEADAALPFGEREEIPVMLNKKCSVPFAVGDCLAVVTLPPGMSLDMLAYAIRHGYAGPRA